MGDLVDVGHDPGDVRGGLEAADLHTRRSAWAAQLVLEVLEVDASRHSSLRPDRDEVDGRLRATAASFGVVAR